MFWCFLTKHFKRDCKLKPKCNISAVGLKPDNCSFFQEMKKQNIQLKRSLDFFSPIIDNNSFIHASAAALPLRGEGAKPTNSTFSAAVIAGW